MICHCTPFKNMQQETPKYIRHAHQKQVNIPVVSHGICCHRSYAALIPCATPGFARGCFMDVNEVWHPRPLLRATSRPPAGRPTTAVPRRPSQWVVRTDCRPDGQASRPPSVSDGRHDGCAQWFASWTVVETGLFT